MLVVVTRCFAVMGGGCHRLAMDFANGVCVGCFPPGADEPVPLGDNIFLIRLASPPSVSAGRLSAISDSLRLFYRLYSSKYTPE